MNECEGKDCDRACEMSRSSKLSSSFVMLDVVLRLSKETMNIMETFAIGAS